VPFGSRFSDAYNRGMSEAPTAAARRVGAGTTRLARAWRVLPHESRLAAFASMALFLTLFLPWYQVTLIDRGQRATLQSASATITGWGAFSFVEAAVLLVAAGVLTLLFQRAEGRAFHLPGGDGGVITAAGVWTCVLVVWRIFDKQGASTNGPAATSSGVEWGIFTALAAGAFLAYSGSRIRAAHRPEPPLPGEDRAPIGSNAAADTTEHPHGREPRRGGSTGEPRRRTPSTQPRRRARTPRPVATDGEPRATPDWKDDATPVRPRHRVSAAELFERVVPEDPPAMRFGRIPPSSRASFPTASEPENAASDDDQLTIPFREDETLRLGEDETLRLRNDETHRLGEDETLSLGEDDTLPLRRRPER